jgi:aspartokinase
MSETRSRVEPIAVIKIGGSILRNSRAYREAARFLSNRHRAAPEERLVVVVSAEEGTTDALEREAREIVDAPNPTSLDLLWSTGEIRSVALLALHLQALGIAVSPLNIHEAGLSVPLNADNNETIGLNPHRLEDSLARNPLAIVPGFLATDPQGAIRSLGRGGSDLTAVLLAEGLAACRCELVKDVPGYFTSDPHQDSAARHLAFLTFGEALKLADEGCDLVQRMAIEAAARTELPLVIRSLDERAPVSRVARCQGSGNGQRPRRPKFNRTVAVAKEIVE